MKDNCYRKKWQLVEAFTPRDEMTSVLELKRIKVFGRVWSLEHRVLLCALNYLVWAFQRVPIKEFLIEEIWGFHGVNNVKRLRTTVHKGLKIWVNHCCTKQTYTIAGLTQENARDIFFEFFDPEGKSPQWTSVVMYFKDEWGKDIMHQNSPCLDLGNDHQTAVLTISLAFNSSRSTDLHFRQASHCHIMRGAKSAEASFHLIEISVQDTTSFIVSVEVRQHSAREWWLVKQ